MICQRCQQDRYTLYNLHMLGANEEVCVNCLTPDEFDWTHSAKWPEFQEDAE